MPNPINVIGEQINTSIPPGNVIDNTASVPFRITDDMAKYAKYINKTQAILDTTTGKLISSEAPTTLYPRVLRSGVIPALHLAKFVASSNPNVGIVGDSTSQFNGISGPLFGTPGITPIDNLSNILLQRLRQDNPKKTITFQNLAIGGATWNSLDSVAGANWPAFYFNHALPWLPYVQASNLTTLFINLGVNDSLGFTPSAMRSVLNKIVSWGSAPPTRANNTAYTMGQVISDSNGRLQIASNSATSGGSNPSWAITGPGTPTADGGVSWQLLNNAVYIPNIPDLVFITNHNANPYSAAPFNTPAFLLGTLNAAAIQRTAALSGMPGFNIPSLPPVGLIDIGRYFTMCFNGFDPVEQYMTQSVIYGQGGPIPSFPYSLPVTAGDFDINLSIPVAALPQDGAHTFSITLGETGNIGNPVSNINFTPQTGGAMYFNIGDGSGQANQAFYLAGVLSTVSDNILQVTVRNERIYVSSNGNLLLDMNITRFAGPFQPRLSFSGTLAPNPVVQLNFYSVGTNRQYAPILNALQVFGTYAGAAGGNGINHDSSNGVNAIDSAVLEATRFA